MVRRVFVGVLRWILSAIVLIASGVANLATAQVDTSAMPASAPVVWLYCVDAERLSGDSPLFETRVVELRLTGVAVPQPRRDDLAAVWTRARVWPEDGIRLRLRKIDDAQSCPASQGYRMALDVLVTAELLDEAGRDTERGELSAAVRLRAIRSIASVREQLGVPTTVTRRHWFRIHYATNRLRVGTNASTAFADGQAASTSFGTVAVAVPHRPHMDRVMSAAVERIDAVTDVSMIHVGEISMGMSLSQWKESIARHAGRNQDRGVLVFFHGYNNSFADAARRAAQLTYDLGWPGATVVFSWPSHNSLWDYGKDGSMAESSRDAAKDMLTTLTGMADIGPIFIVAHSMGNRVMLSALKQFLLAHGANSTDRTMRLERIKQVVMAAPDVPLDWYEAGYESMFSSFNIRPTLYANKFDLSMWAAPVADGERPWRDKVPGKVRLGAGGDALMVRGYLDSVDASAAAHDMFALNHSYFGDHTKVLSDLFRLLRVGEAATNRKDKTIELRGGRDNNGWSIRVPAR